MKISEITQGRRDTLSAYLTVMVSGETKKALDLIAQAKGRPVSSVVREIVDGFLANNADELQKLDQGA